MSGPLLRNRLKVTSLERAGTMKIIRRYYAALRFAIPHTRFEPAAKEYGLKAGGIQRQAGHGVTHKKT